MILHEICDNANLSCRALQVRDHAKDLGKELSTKMHIAFFDRILIESLNIRNQNAMHFGIKFLVPIFGIQ